MLPVLRRGTADAGTLLFLPVSLVWLAVIGAALTWRRMPQKQRATALNTLFGIAFFFISLFGIALLR